MANGKLGRPATGQVPVRTVRLGAVWEEARAAAKEDGLRFADWLERVIRAELRRRHRRG